MALATYTCEQLRQATDGYSDSRILGQGGFGVVYSGKVHDSPVPVAVKRIMLNDKKKAKMKSFSREIACAGVTGRHPNLVDVVGMASFPHYADPSQESLRTNAHPGSGGTDQEPRCAQCKDSADELALVYAPVASTSLANTLLPAGKAEVTLLPLERINIALSVVKGLQALHDARQVGISEAALAPVPGPRPSAVSGTALTPLRRPTDSFGYKERECSANRPARGKGCPGRHGE